MNDCIFCKIVNKEIPADTVYEDKNILAFKDINPQAPVHIIIVPKTHIATLNNVNEKNSKIISEIFEQIPLIAKKYNIFETGYRVISNCGKDGQQTVNHIHFHILGGRKLPDSLG